MIEPHGVGSLEYGFRNDRRHFPGMDPEFNDTMNYYAQLRQLSLGVSVKF